MIQSGKSMRDWLSRYHIVIVLVLSLLHVSLAALHTRDSGKADLSPLISHRTRRVPPAEWGGNVILLLVRAEQQRMFLICYSEF